MAANDHERRDANVESLIHCDRRLSELEKTVKDVRNAMGSIAANQSNIQSNEKELLKFIDELERRIEEKEVVAMKNMQGHIDKQIKFYRKSMGSFLFVGMLISVLIFFAITKAIDSQKSGQSLSTFGSSEMLAVQSNVISAVRNIISEKETEFKAQINAQNSEIEKLKNQISQVMQENTSLKMQLQNNEKMLNSLKSKSDRSENATIRQAK